MAEKMHRAQILLEIEQHRALAELARREGASISELVRRIIGDWLADQREMALWQRREEALQELRGIRESVQARYGVIQEDLIAESRQERDQEIGTHIGSEE